MTDWLASRVAISPQAPAVWVGSVHYTYANLWQLTQEMCGWLASYPWPANRRVAMLLPNSVPAIAAVYAAARLGLVLVPLNTRLTLAELSWQLAHTQCEWLICDEPTAGLAQQLPGRLLNLSQRTQTASFTPHPWALEQTQAIVFTSGTSGRPKGVELTFGNHFYSAMSSAYRLGLQASDLWLSCLPLYHVGGLAVVFRSCLYGTAIDLHPKFELAEVQQALAEKPITMISLVPTMLYRLLESPTTWPGSLRLALIGGAAASPELVSQAISQGIPLSTTYGMTETASQIATNPPAEQKAKPGSVGQPLLFTQVKVLDEAGQEQSAGSYGELWVAGPTVMKGYFNNPAANQERLVGAFFRTGDIGYKDEAGDLFVVQRRTDLIVSGGENVYPAEVETVLRQHPAVQEVCVVGVPDPEWGQKVAAMIQTRPGQMVSETELALFCQGQLAGYKRPRLWQLVTELPLTASGKIHRPGVTAAFLATG